MSGSGWKPRRIVWRPSKKSVQAAIAAQSPDGWEPKPREKKRRKLVEGDLENLAGEDDPKPE